jgi:hypothetical protein
MRLRHVLALLLALLVVPGVVACGKKEPAPGPSAQAVEDDVTKLVPNDTVGLVYAPSLDALQRKIRDVVASIDAEAAAEVDLDKMLSDPNVPAALRSNLDRTRPVAIAVSFAGERPVPTIILPSKGDAVALGKAFEEQGMAPPATSGKYLAATMGPPPSARGGSEIAKKAPAGDVALRLDVARLVAQFRPQIDQGLAELTRQMEAGAGPQAGAMRPMVEWMASAVNSAEWLDVALKIEGTRVDFEGELRMKAGSEFDGKLPASQNLASLAGNLPKDFPVVALASVDLESLMGFLEKFMDAALAAFPEDQRKVLADQFRQGREAYKLLGKEHAMGFGIGPNGIEAVTLSASSDPKAYIAKSIEMAKANLAAGAEMGVLVETLPSTTVEGVEVSTWKMNFDWEKLFATSGGGRQMPPEAAEQIQGVMQMVFGPGGLQVHSAPVEGKVVTVLGGPELLSSAIQSAKKGGKAPERIADSIRRAGGKPSLLFHLELRSLATQVTDLLRRVLPPEQASKIPTIPAGSPVVLLVHATGDGRTYRGGLSADVGAGAALVKSVVEQVDR